MTAYPPRASCPRRRNCSDNGRFTWVGFGGVDSLFGLSSDFSVSAGFVSVDSLDCSSTSIVWLSSTSSLLIFK